LLRIGYKASAEQFGPNELLEFSCTAEAVGFDSVFISDHFQPWKHTGGHAPASIAWLGALGARTTRIIMGTSVMTPTFRYHPSVVAQAFATLGVMFPDRVVLYAATPADQASALSAAQAAGLPASQVTQSFATAWDDTLSGNYLVISVGLAATDALYFNVCGWANPSGDIPGSTPFYIVSGPRDTLPGAGAYEEAAAATAAKTPQFAADLAYYAVHGALPPGVTALPAAAGPQYACAGSPS